MGKIMKGIFPPGHHQLVHSRECFKLFIFNLHQLGDWVDDVMNIQTKDHGALNLLGEPPMNTKEPNCRKEHKRSKRHD